MVVAPAAWRGALPITYHIGPGPARVRLHVEFNWDITPAYNIIAVMPGSEHRDEWVIRGNHRDGWAMGAADPISGLVALMAEARAVGELARAGSPPRRTIVYAGWDAEEPGLLGSTEWAEHHRDELHEKAVIYINTDGNGRGFLSAGGSHTLERFVNEVAKEVTDPQTGVSVWERVKARRAVQGDPSAQGDGDLWIAPLESGSDYTPFTIVSWRWTPSGYRPIRGRRTSLLRARTRCPSSTSRRCRMRSASWRAPRKRWTARWPTRWRRDPCRQAARPRSTPSCSRWNRR